jgi:hypothetical protein
MPAKKKQAADDPVPMQRQDTGSLLSDLFGEMVLNEEEDREAARQVPMRGTRAAAIGIAFVDKNGNRFVSPNTLHAYNPDDHFQVGHVEERMKAMHTLAEQMEVGSRCSVVKFYNEDSGVILTKVGGASPGYVSKKFPPHAHNDWLSPPKPYVPKQYKTKGSAKASPKKAASSADEDDD